METGRTKIIDLNELNIANHEGADIALENFSIVNEKEISIFFKEIKKHLISEIEKAEVIIGCIAWLTDYEVLDCLAKKKHISIIVQKEEFLRPDLGFSSDFKQTLREKYERIKNNLERYNLEAPACDLSYCSDPAIEAIRCMGINSGKKIAPKMHHKFLIFGKYIDSKKENEMAKIEPISVWSGSYNISRNSNYSLENAILIKNKKIAKAYYKEYCQILALSEPLDWEQEYIEPEWRIGT